MKSRVLVIAVLSMLAAALIAIVSPRHGGSIVNVVGFPVSRVEGPSEEVEYSIDGVGVSCDLTRYSTTVSASHAFEKAFAAPIKSIRGCTINGLPARNCRFGASIVVGQDFSISALIATVDDLPHAVFMKWHYAGARVKEADMRIAAQECLGRRRDVLIDRIASSVLPSEGTRGFVDGRETDLLTWLCIPSDEAAGGMLSASVPVFGNFVGDCVWKR